ncbi:MAG: response regulator [Desulfamplus sp.]|nr:response regulator [Desulfamplus sp.]MBF0414003.1 response regulator [Desulfamplus sp.]
MSEEYKILVVDDDAFAAELTGITLESAGYDVVLAEGGIDALEKIADDPLIRIVVSDMNMPMVSGVELFEEIRKLGMVQPFVLLTGEEAESLKNAYPAIDAVIAKDEQFQDVLPQLIERLLAR